MKPAPDIIRRTISLTPETAEAVDEFRYKLKLRTETATMGYLVEEGIRSLRTNETSTFRGTSVAETLANKIT